MRSASGDAVTVRAAGGDALAIGTRQSIVGTIQCSGVGVFAGSATRGRDQAESMERDGSKFFIGQRPGAVVSTRLAFPSYAVLHTSFIRDVPGKRRKHLDGRTTRQRARATLRGNTRPCGLGRHYPDRVTDATQSIVQVTIDEFEGDGELKIKFARLLDLLAVDQDDLETAALDNAAHMTTLFVTHVALRRIWL